MAMAKKPIRGDQTTHYVSARQKRGKDRPNPAMQPPLTPMIDVVFQLLLFFLVSTQFIQEEGQLQAKVPKLDKNPPPVRRLPIRVVLTPMGTDGTGVQIAIENLAEPIGDFEGMYTLMVSLNERDGADTPVIIKPASDVAWEHAVNAYNQAVRAKFKNVAFQESES